MVSEGKVILVRVSTTSTFVVLLLTEENIILLPKKFVQTIVCETKEEPD